MKKNPDCKWELKKDFKYIINFQNHWHAYYISYFKWYRFNTVY